MREPFTLEQLHLFNFPYFLYFSACASFSYPASLIDNLPKRSGWVKNNLSRPHLRVAAAAVVCSTSPVLPPLLQRNPHPEVERGLALQYTNPMCLKSAQDCVHGAHAGRRWNRLGGHTGGGSGGGGAVSKLLPLADVGGGAKDGLDVVVIQLWSEMERGPHLVRCAGLLLLLAGVGAQKKLLEKVLKKTTTLKPRLLQTSDGKHCRSSPDVATRSLGLNVNDKSMNIQGANFMGIMSCSFTPNFVG